MLIQLILTLAILGVIYYLITLLPIQEPFRTIINVVIIVAVIIWLLGFLGGHGTTFVGYRPLF